VHDLVQSPQYEASELRSLQTPLQSVWPAGHEQMPPEQAFPPGHEDVVVVSTLLLLQSTCTRLLVEHESESL
jgi:hypothetical protein